MTKDKREVIICTCGSLTHAVGIDFIDWDEHYEPELYIETVCSPYLPWYKRVWIAIRYVFGLQTASIDASLISREDAERISDIVRTYKIEYDAWKANIKNVH